MSLPPRSQMGPPQDVVMGPPPVPSQIAPSSSTGARLKEPESQDVSEKYRRLKRKFFELEEVRHCPSRVVLPASDPLSPSAATEIQRYCHRASELEQTRRAMAERTQVRRLPCL